MPEELIEDFRNYRAAMIEKVAETDDDLMLKFLEEEEITNDEIKAALRRATIDNKIVPLYLSSSPMGICIATGLACSL